MKCRILYFFFFNKQTNKKKSCDYYTFRFSYICETFHLILFATHRKSPMAYYYCYLLFVFFFFFFLLIISVVSALKWSMHISWGIHSTDITTTHCACDKAQFAVIFFYRQLAFFPYPLFSVYLSNVCLYKKSKRN